MSKPDRAPDPASPPSAELLGPPEGPFVHATAAVDEGAQVGPGTRVWHWTHVCPGAVVGADCVLGQNVYVAGEARLGRGVRVQNNVSIYDRVAIEDGAFIGPSVVFTNVVNPRSQISRKHAYLSTRVREGATLGANATVVCGVTIGRYSFVGAGAVVTRDVADHALVMGVPARAVGWVCRCGVRLEALAGAEAGGPRRTRRTRGSQILDAPPGDASHVCPECQERYALRSTGMAALDEGAQGQAP